MIGVLDDDTIAERKLSGVCIECGSAKKDNHYQECPSIVRSADEAKHNANIQNAINRMAMRAGKI